MSSSIVETGLLLFANSVSMSLSITCRSVRKTPILLSRSLLSGQGQKAYSLSYHATHWLALEQIVPLLGLYFALDILLLCLYFCLTLDLQ